MFAFRELFREIGEDLGQDFAFAALRFANSRQPDPSLLIRLVSRHRDLRPRSSQETKSRRLVPSPLLPIYRAYSGGELSCSPRLESSAPIVPCGPVCR